MKRIGLVGASTECALSKMPHSLPMAVKSVSIESTTNALEADKRQLIPSQPNFFIRIGDINKNGR